MELEILIENKMIWRYMDLSRFVSMISTSRLWFAKAANLRDDPYEGFSNVRSLETPLNDTSPKTTIEHGASGDTYISLPQCLARASQESAAYCKNAPDHLYVNSWCLSGIESMAMWEIYGSKGCGLAIKSSVDKYQRAAKFDVPPSHYAFGKVRYHDVLETAPEVRRDFTKSINFGEQRLKEVLNLGFHKRSCYKYEIEWRAALYQDKRPEISGLYECFDLGELISEVHIGPRADEFFVDVVKSIMDKYLLQKPLICSTLLSDPRLSEVAGPR